MNSTTAAPSVSARVSGGGGKMRGSAGMATQPAQSEAAKSNISTSAVLQSAAQLSMAAWATRPDTDSSTASSNASRRPPLARCCDPADMVMVVPLSSLRHSVLVMRSITLTQRNVERDGMEHARRVAICLTRPGQAIMVSVMSLQPMGSTEVKV